MIGAWRWLPEAQLAVAVELEAAEAYGRAAAIDPTNADRQIVAHDQGLSITQNRGKTWFRQRLLNAQIYHVTVDNEIPYNVLGNKQDEPSYRGPSNSRVTSGRGAGISRGMWHSVGGGESGWATPIA